MKPKITQLSRLAVLATVLVAGCGNPARDQEKIQSLDSLNVIDENNLNEIMLDFADANQSVAYFQRSLAENPDRVEFKQGLAQSLLRAGRPEESILAYKALVEAGQATSTDRLKYAEALIQVGKWKESQAQLNAVPPTLETYDRYRLEAMVADNNKQWKRADSYYDQARGLTTRPANIYNNWGISKLARGDRPAAEEMFTRAISYDPKLFSAKNNLAISRASRKEYDLPIVPLTTTEQAELLHNIALQAIRNGDVDIGRGLLEEAVERHPRHFAEAVRKLDALEKTVLR
ncbi:tetratricopeptide repeat protein [Oceanibium sediminis]|uniref:tetratricopeptide repeat protein n=1 Tax=Oceanibium sediminis TaxID=2026339 RepID=UPI000DD493D1|nr:tetratricopeptide repeat protein [Oceanibium sediminis]